MELKPRTKKKAHSKKKKEEVKETNGEEEETKGLEKTKETSPSKNGAKKSMNDTSEGEMKINQKEIPLDTMSSEE